MHADRLVIPLTDELPPSPEDFDAEHARVWATVCSMLRDNGILTVADLFAVRAFVEAKVTAKRTYAVLIAADFMLDDRKHPLHMVYCDAVKTMRALFDQFGMTPRARMALKAIKPEGPELSPFETMLREAGVNF